MDQISNQMAEANTQDATINEEFLRLLAETGRDPNEVTEAPLNVQTDAEVGGTEVVASGSVN